MYLYTSNDTMILTYEAEAAARLAKLEAVIIYTIII